VRLKAQVTIISRIFVRLESQVANISRSVGILMDSLENKVNPSSVSKTNEKPEYHEETRKEKEEPNIEKGDSNNQYFEHHFKMEG
jgi:hypothetical protein